MKNVVFLLLPLFLLFSCEDNKDLPLNENFDIDCSKLMSGLEDKNLEQINLELNKLTQDLNPNSIPGDEIGHAENLDKLIERINANCENIQATKICYACIETLPAQSEIKIEFESAGNLIERIVDISTPDDDVLKSISVH